MLKRTYLLLSFTIALAVCIPPVQAGTGARPPRFYYGYAGHIPRAVRHSFAAPAYGLAGYAGGPYGFSMQGPFNDYGPFTGARHDEELLLRLGGEGPYSGTPDIITLIEGRRAGYGHP